MIFNSKYQKIIEICKNLNCKFLENEPLKKYTSFKIGGNADILIYVANENALKNIIKTIKQENIQYFILGKGSNLLVSDKGFKGIVLILDGEFKKIEKNENIITCGAGNSLGKICVFAMQNGLSGLEFAWGIPGSCGGALFMNAGAYQKEISDIIIDAKHIEDSGETKILTKDKMNLGYRNSIYSKNNYIITSMRIKLEKSNSETIRKKMYEIINKRKSKQPLNYPSAGSTFKRPGNGYYAGALIQSANLKGVSVGGAMVSNKHSGFIVNKGNATAQDVVALIKLVKEKVFIESGINLECEIKTLGDIKI